MTFMKIVALLAGLLLAALAAGGTAVAGNSTAAKKCQKNGWQTLVTSGLQTLQDGAQVQAGP